MGEKRHLASISLDLDNKWSYMKIHGDPGWEQYPSYLDMVVPRILEVAADHKMSMTFFIVGRDAARSENQQALASITAEDHEVGNHSYNHEPWLHLYSRDQVEAEIADAEAAIEAATGQRPRGFRGPGFSISPFVLETLRSRGYAFDASTFPTYLGPFARAYYFATSRLPREERERRKSLFGGFSEGFRALRPYRWNLQSGSLLEIPVTTIPGIKIPFHLSYVLYLASYSKSVARRYFRAALAACRAFRVEPSLLLHPLDFLGGDDVPELNFFPAMQLSATEKLALVDELMAIYNSRFSVKPMGLYASLVEARGKELKLVAPRPTPLPQAG